jgi:4-amino-4-deoxy-L-arabinose transferase-like glycosyltransferase
VTAPAQPSDDTRVTPAATRREAGVVAALTAAFVAVVSLWAILTPIYGAPDETAHLNSAIRLTQGFDWPPPGEARMAAMVIAARDEAQIAARDRSTFAQLVVSYPGDGGIDQMSQHPPLYYGYAAAVLTSVGFMDLRADLALLAVRLAGLLFVLPLPLLVWDSVRRLTRSAKAGVVGAAALFAVPQLAHIVGSVSNDGLTILLCSVVAWLSVRVMTGDARWRVILSLGVALGLALLSKGTALPFVPFVLATLLIWPRVRAMSWRLLRAGAVAAIAFAVGGWWWVRNVLLFGDLQPSGLALVRETKPWEPGTGPDVVAYLDLMWSRLSGNFWGDFGLLDYALPELLTDVLSLVSLAMIVAYFFVRDAEKLRMAVLASLPALLLIMLVVNTWRHYVRTQLPGGMQGRYLFVVIVILIALSAVAWSRLVPVGRHRRAAVILLVMFAAVAAVGLFREYIGAYEGSQYRVTRAGLSAWAVQAPAGAGGIAVAAVITAALSALTLVSSIRFVRRPLTGDTHPTLAEHIEAKQASSSKE